MSKQLDILDWLSGHAVPPPSMAIARATDPRTSHQAAVAITPDLPELEAAVLHALRAAGAAGMTLDQICDATGLDKVTASPRLRSVAERAAERRRAHAAHREAA